MIVDFVPSTGLQDHIAELKKKARSSWDAIQSKRFYPQYKFLEDPKQSPLQIAVECSYTKNDGTSVGCQTSAFGRLTFNRCDVGVNYTYYVINNSEKDATLDFLLDENLSKISVRGSNLLTSEELKTYRTVGRLDVCTSEEEITKKVLAIASPVDSNEKLPYAEDSFTVQAP